MVPRPLAPARAMRSRTGADVIQPCCRDQQCQVSRVEINVQDSVEEHQTTRWIPWVIIRFYYYNR